MAKLYWRYKKNGKWTFAAACIQNTAWVLNRDISAFGPGLMEIQYKGEKDE